MVVSVKVWTNGRGDAKCDRAVFDSISECVGDCDSHGGSVCCFDGLSVGDGAGDELGGGGPRSSLCAAAAEWMVQDSDADVRLGTGE